MAKLYEITDSILELLEGVDEDGEPAPDFLERLDALGIEHSKKVEALCGYVRQAGFDAKALREEADFYARKARRAEAAMDRAKAYLMFQMARLNVQKMEAGPFKIRTQANPPSYKLAEGVVPEELPAFLKRTTVEFNAKAAAEAVKSGAKLPASVVVVQGSHVRIS